LASLLSVSGFLLQNTTHFSGPAKFIVYFEELLVQNWLHGWILFFIPMRGNTYWSCPLSTNCFLMKGTLPLYWGFDDISKAISVKNINTSKINIFM